MLEKGPFLSLSDKISSTAFSPTPLIDMVGAAWTIKINFKIKVFRLNSSVICMVYV
jgi:hypothetical protein